MSVCLLPTTDDRHYLHAQAAGTRASRQTDDRQSYDIKHPFVFVIKGERKMCMCPFVRAQSILASASHCLGTFGEGMWTAGQRDSTEPPVCASPFAWKPFPGTQISMTYSNWHPLNPKCQYKLEACVEMCLDSSMSDWSDARCSSALGAFCEVDP